MKRALATIMVALFMSSNCIHRQVIAHGYEAGNPVTIHEKVGETIDREERDHYLLFRGVQGFVSATFFDVSGGGYVVKIATDRGIYCSVNRDPKAFAVLRDLMDLRARIAEEEKEKKHLLEKYRCGFCAGLQSGKWIWEFETKWKIEAYDALGFPISRHEIDRYKDWRAPYLGALGCLAFGAPLGAVLGCVAAQGEPYYDTSNPGVGWGIFTAAVAMSSIGGVHRGNMLAKMKIISAIRETRKPTKIE
jgi:hypothetical protein